jgi:hypothetical protein
MNRRAVCREISIERSVTAISSPGGEIADVR